MDQPPCIWRQSGKIGTISWDWTSLGDAKTLSVEQETRRAVFWKLFPGQGVSSSPQLGRLLSRTTIVLTTHMEHCTVK